MLTEQQLDWFHTDGFVLVPDVLSPDEVDVLQRGVWENVPSPEQYFADPGAYTHLTDSAFAGLTNFPWASPELNRLVAHPRILAIVRQILGVDDIRLYKGELWAKYAGNADYDQHHHRDYENHTIVVPRADQLMPQMTCFILLSDVTEVDGPTKAVPLDKTRDVPIGITQTEMGRFFEDEVAVTGPAGTILIYKTDVFHRGSNFKAPGRSRFVMPIDFKKRGWRWQGKLAWPDRTLNPGWKEAMVNMTPRQRDLFGWPPPGDPYWNAQTLRDVALRYPGIDLAPYGAEAAA